MGKSMPFTTIVIVMAVGAVLGRILEPRVTSFLVKNAEVVSSAPFMTRNMTAADYEEAYVESSGTTAEITPVSLSESFVGSYLGKQVLDLQNTTATFNDSLNSGPISDVQAFYENPWVADPFQTGGVQ
jgi:hypothetical protein